MNRFISIIICAFVMFGTTGCGGDSNTEKDNQTNISDFPTIEKMANRALDEMKSSPAIQDTKTEFEYNNSTSNTKDTIALHYNTSNNGEVTLLYNTESNTLKSATVEMDEKNALESDDFIAIISSFSSISDFNITSDQYSKIGEIAANMETTMVGDMTVSMKNIEGIYEFMIIMPE